MSAKTGISWTGSTWTPLRARRKDTGKVGVACVKVSPGCKHCYAERLNMRNLPQHGTGLEFTVLNMAKVEMFLDEAILQWPLQWKRPRMIFVNSQTDTFGEFATDEQIDQMFAVMALCPQHTFQVLTKRADRMLEWTQGKEFGDDDSGEWVRDLMIEGSAQAIYAKLHPGEDPSMWLGVHQPLPNVHLGVSVENQEWADKRIPPLLHTPAAKRFVSAEPLLGPLDLSKIPQALNDCEPTREQIDGPMGIHYIRHGAPGLDWIIIGGESGPGARPFRVEWAESIIEQCRFAGVPVFLKQLGAYPIWAGSKCLPIEPARGKNDDPEQWPESLRVQEFPAVLNAV